MEGYLYIPIPKIGKLVFLYTDPVDIYNKNIYHLGLENLYKMINKFRRVLRVVLPARHVTYSMIKRFTSASTIVDDFIDYPLEVRLLLNHFSTVLRFI